MPYLIQKHIPQKHSTGNIFMNKTYMADFADLIRTSPSSARVLIMLATYADNNNSVISDLSTIAKLLGLDIKTTKFAIKKLLVNGYITVTEVKLDHHHKIKGVIHDKKLYRESHKKVWKVVGEKLVTNVTLKGTYNRFKLNFDMFKCNSSSDDNNILKYIHKNLFYDANINDNELIWEV